jgi:glycosyltransferase involved in cell wall biosynthesis
VRILVVSQYFWPESFRINELVSSLVKRGVKVDVLTGKPNYPDGKVFPGYQVAGCNIEDWSGAQVYRVPLIPRGRKSALRLALNYLSFVVSGTVFGAWSLRGVKPDVILVYAPSPLLQALPALFLARLKGCPVVLWVQDLWPESLDATGHVRRGWILRLVGRVVRFIYRRSDLILLSSRSFADFVQEFAPAQRLVYYPNSVDNSFCHPNAGPKPELDALNAEFTIVFAGNVGVAQSVETIIEAAEKLRNLEGVRFVVFGSGSRLDWMHTETVRRELKNVVLAGRYPIETMPFLLSRAKALLVTLTDRPIFAVTVPNKVQAYMAVGRPIIGCLNGEGAELIRESGAGMVVAAEDAAGLAEVVRHLHSLPAAELEAMGASGQRYFREHFDHEMLVDKLVTHFHQLARQAAASQ